MDEIATLKYKTYKLKTLERAESDAFDAFMKTACASARGNNAMASVDKTFDNWKDAHQLTQTFIGELRRQYQENVNNPRANVEAEHEQASDQSKAAYLEWRELKAGPAGPAGHEAFKKLKQSLYDHLVKSKRSLNDELSRVYSLHYTDGENKIPVNL